MLLEDRSRRGPCKTVPKPEGHLPTASSLVATSGHSTGRVVRCSLLYRLTIRSRLPICCLNLSVCW